MLQVLESWWLINDRYRNGLGKFVSAIYSMNRSPNHTMVHHVEVQWSPHPTTGAADGGSGGVYAKERVLKEELVSMTTSIKRKYDYKDLQGNTDDMEPVLGLALNRLSAHCENV